jgi:hypothetical protein
MTFRWTKLYRIYDLEKFAGNDTNIPNDPFRYSFTKKNGTIVSTDSKENFFREKHKVFLGWHSDDLKNAFPFFIQFNTLEEAIYHFNLEIHPVHKDKITGTKFALHDNCTLKMTIEFKNKEEWKKFVDRNHDPKDPITHGMKVYKKFCEYDKDYLGEKDPVLL